MNAPFKSPTNIHRRPAAYTGEDTFDYRGATRVACMISDYWARRSKHPKVEIVPLEGHRDLFRVQTDMINGMPRA
jgi:hypothetical protein